MKKIVSMLLALTLVFSSTSFAFAANDNEKELNTNQVKNIMITEGYLTVNNNKTEITEAYKDYARDYAKENNLIVEFTENSITYRSAKRGGGVTKIVWYGPCAKVYLDDVTTRKLTIGCTGSAIAAGLIPDPTVSKMLGAILAVNAMIFGNVNKGNGVIAYVALLPPPGICQLLWVKAQ